MDDWCTQLTAEQQGKIARELQAWLNGKSPKELGLISPEPDKVKVYGRYKIPVFDDNLEYYFDMGLEAEDGDEVSAGVITQEQLISLAQDDNIISLTPVRMGRLFNSSEQDSF